MLTRLFPKQVDNDHQGWRLAIWLLVPLVLLKLLQGANVAWGNSRHILETADRVPVGTFPPEAASHLVFLFASWASASSSWASSGSSSSSATAG